MTHKVLIFDLDNCISHDEWRIKFIRWKEPTNWHRFDQYHRMSVGDAPGNLHLFKPHLHNVFFTARPEFYRAHTEHWFRKHNVQMAHLFMRENNDDRGSVEIKMDMLDRLLTSGIAALNQIACAYDDREDIIAAYLAAGVNAERRWLHTNTVFNSGGKNGKKI